MLAVDISVDIAIKTVVDYRVMTVTVILPEHGGQPPAQLSERASDEDARLLADRRGVGQLTEPSKGVGLRRRDTSIIDYSISASLG